MMTPRILILIKGLGRGGAEQLIVSEASRFDTSNFEYEVAYLLPWKNALVGELERVGLRVTCLSGARGPGWIGRLRRLVHERDIDLVHVHSPYAAIGSRVAFGSRHPRLVYTEHNVWSRYHRATYWGNLLTFWRNDRVLAVSDEVRRSISYPAALSRLPMPPVETLYHGIDLDAVDRWMATDGVRAELGIGESAPLIGMVANFKPHKAHDVLLRAARIVRRAVSDVRFVLVGTGPLEGEVRRQARALDLDGTVLFAGFREDAQRLMSSFDVFVLPSTYEGLSIALLEAMALGKPPVVSDIGGLAEVVRNGQEGLLVPPGDEQALAEQMLRLIDDATLRSRLGEAARRRAAEFDIGSAVRRMETLYRELLP